MSALTPEPEFPDETDIPDTVETDMVAEDETSLDGLLFGRGRRAGVVLVHGSGSDRRSWYPFAGRLTSAGYAVMTFDLRGHGRSEGAREPAKYPGDAVEAIEFLADEGAARTVIVGVDAGGTAAIAAAADSEEDVRGVVAIHAGPTFDGLDVTASARRLRKPTLVVTTGGDEGERLSSLVQGAELKSAASPSPDDRALQELLLDFLRRALKP